jgi:hypothetical protein
MAIKIIKSNTITLTQEKYDRLLREWSASQQYTTVPQSFDSWVREYLEAEQRALAAAPHAASQRMKTTHITSLYASILITG